MKDYIEGRHPENSDCYKVTGIKNPVILPIDSTRKANGFLNLTGKRFGKQLCVKHVGSELVGMGRKKALWMIECDCGVSKIARASAVVRRTSCGCVGKEKTIEFNIKTKTKETYSSFSALWQSYKRAARKRGYEFEISKDYFKEITSKNCYYCNSEPSMYWRSRKTKGIIPEFLYNGIDRIDNSVGYVKGNIVPCCKFCNRAKGIFSKDFFMDKVKMIYEHQKLHS